MESEPNRDPDEWVDEPVIGFLLAAVVGLVLPLAFVFPPTRELIPLPFRALLALVYFGVCLWLRSNSHNRQLRAYLLCLAAAACLMAITTAVAWLNPHLRLRFW
jgi:hypothetical protein